MSKSGLQDKPFQISKRLVWEAYKSVKANKGGAGVDGQSIEDFEKGLKNNLFKEGYSHTVLIDLRRAYAEDGPFPGRIGFPDSITKKRAVKNVPYHGANQR